MTMKAPMSKAVKKALQIESERKKIMDLVFNPTQPQTIIVDGKAYRLKLIDYPTK